MELVGRLHPLLVHLPIGILLLAILFEWLSVHPSFKILSPALPLIILLGAISTFSSCLTGYLLSQSGDYSGNTISWHQWLAISLSIVSAIYWWAHYKSFSAGFKRALSIFVLMLVSVTGHLGGSLTHGEDYLTENIFAESVIDFSKINLTKARYYEDLVKPILSQKCYSCHGPSKQKGKLRLDDKAQILKGGKKGVVLVAHKADESELINRLLLPLDEKDHMPPKEKSQLSSIEIGILKEWISSGADFEKSVGELGLIEKLQSIMKAPMEKLAAVPVEKVEPGDVKKINQLKSWEVVILPVAQQSNFLSINLINTTKLDSALSLLKNLKKQIVWLKAGNTSIQDNDLKYLSDLHQLTKLNLENTTLTGEGLSHLQSLTNLQYLNVSNTKVTINSIKVLTPLKNLRTLILYQTKLDTTSLDLLHKLFPQTNVEIGGYSVPALPTDTVKVF
jgi:uncharacterized membrane protein